MFELMRGDHARATAHAFELVRLAREQELTMFRAFGAFLEGWATAAGGAVDHGLEDMRRCAEMLREQNVLYCDGLLKIALAEAEARAGDPDRAVALIDEALATAERTGYRAFEAELHRERGEILLKRDPANSAPAEGSLSDSHHGREAASDAEFRTARSQNFASDGEAPRPRVIRCPFPVS